MEGSLVAYKVFTNGSVLQASEINDNLMRQSVMVFSNAAARTAAITSPLEGMLTWLEDTNRYESYNGTSWVSAFSVSRIVTQTIGTAVTSVTVNNAFSAEFDTYKIVVSGGVGSGFANLRLQLGSSTGFYNDGAVLVTYSSGSTSSLFSTGSTAFLHAGSINTSHINLDVQLINPFATAQTIISGNYMNGGQGGTYSGIHASATSHTSFVIYPATGTMTGGTINVYGYRKN
jgi:hypothetical protein